MKSAGCILLIIAAFLVGAYASTQWPQVNVIGAVLPSS
jgi:hypothetical protein